MLSDGEIRGAMIRREIVLDPPPEDGDIQPASIDVHLGNKFGELVRPLGRQTFLDTPVEMKWFEFGQDDYGYVLLPGHGVIAGIKERLTLDSTTACRIEGKSSLGRKFLAVHITAGFVDPGWDGNLTVEIFNMSDIPYTLRPGDTIAQLAFERLKFPVQRPYGHPELGSHYQGSESARGSLE